MTMQQTVATLFFLFSVTPNLIWAEENCGGESAFCLRLKINSTAIHPLPRTETILVSKKARAVTSSRACHITEIFNENSSTCSCDQKNGWSRSPNSASCVLNQAKKEELCGFGYKLNGGTCRTHRFAKLTAYCKRRGGLWIGNKCKVLSTVEISAPKATPNGVTKASFYQGNSLRLAQR